MSRRKQLNPKSIKGGGQEPIATVPPRPTPIFSDEDDFDDGYRPLVINTEEESPNHLISPLKVDESPNCDDNQPNSPTTNQAALGASDNRRLLKDTVPENLETLETSSSGHNSELERPLTGYSSNAESLHAMTLGSMDYGSDDSQEYSGSKRLVVSPAVYRGQNTPIAKPRQPTPSKTRRKSDKIVPVVTPEGEKFICPVCKISLTSNNELTVHIRSHNTTSAINTCTICGKVLSSQSSLDRHMLVHSGERPFKCKICDMSFTTNGNMHRHSRIHEKEGNSHGSSLANSHKEPKETKKARRQRPSNLMSYTMHNPSGGVKRKHSSDDESTNDFLMSMERQENSHLMDRENAEQHVVSPEKPPQHTDSHEIDNLTCPICLQTFLCKYGLDTHFETHGAEPASCQLCHLNFPSSRLVYLHYFIMHVDRKKLREFANQYSKQTNGLTPLASGFHELAFTDFSTEKFAHIAKVWCEKNQRRSNSIFHNFHCKKCDHAFPSADVLRMHLAMHPDICDVTCQTCDVTFASKQEFEDHVIQHSTEQVIESFSKRLGTDDNDIQDMLSQPEFLLCLGLKSNKSTSDWCNNNAIESAADKYNNQIATPVASKPVNHVTPIVIEPRGDAATLPHVPRPSAIPNHVPQTHPAFPVKLIPSFMAQNALHGSTAPVEISSSSDGEGDSDVENSDTIKQFQCVICEFAFSSLTACEKHCRSAHHLATGKEIKSAIKVNPYSGQQRINPDLSFMPYLCKKCTNGFSNKENCIRHIHKQHGIRRDTVVQYIATNKRLQDGVLQPSYLAGVKDARDFIAKNVQRLREPKMGSTRSAFYPAVPSQPPQIYPANPGTYITSPPITPITVKQEPGDNEQPLDFSMKKEQATSDFSTQKPIEQIDDEIGANDADDMPMDLSVKPCRDTSSSTVAPDNVVSPSQSLLSSMSSPLGLLNVREPFASFSADVQTSNNASGGSGSKNPLAGSGCQFVAPLALAPPQAPPPVHVNVQQFYVSGLGKFQCPLCCLLFKNGYQLQCHLAQQHSPATAAAQRAMYRCKHCPATYSSKANIEQHILKVHPHIHAPLFVSTPKDHHQANHSKSAQSSPALSQREANKSPGLSYNSDSDLSSVAKILDCASSSKFQAFFAGSDATEIKSPSSKYLQPGMVPTTSPNPLHTLEQVFGKRTDESLTDGSTNCSRDSLATSPSHEEPPTKRKRNSYSDSPHKLQCPYCPRAFPWISSLKRHILTHTGQKPFKCPECPVTFSTKSNRERHMVRKHGLDIQDPTIRASMDKPYRCHNCGETFVSAGNTKDHYKEVHAGHGIPDYIIQQAKFELLSSSSNQEKLIDGQVEAMSVVSDMSDLTSSLVDFDEDDEELDAERMKKAAATATAAATPSPTPLSTASSPAPMIHPDSLAFPMNDEAPEYLTKINPERDNYNVDRITGCWKCGMKFDSRKILLRHLKDHNIDYSYKCYLCDASFESRITCLQHTETVHRHDWVLLREKNKCYNLVDYSNNVEAQVQETLANLGLNADGEEIEGAPKMDPADEKGNADSDYAQRKVFCSFCVKRFWSLQDLRRHMRSHTGERPFECDICQKRFTLKHSMMRHRRKHTAAEISQAAAEAVSSPACYSDEEPAQAEVNMEDEHTPCDVTVPSPIAMATVPARVSGAIFSNNDLLHNLLGVDPTQIDQMLQTRATDAAKLLGVGDK